MRIGRFSLRQRWVDREVSPSLTAVAALLIALGGFALGVAVGRGWDGVSLPFPWYSGIGGLGLGETQGEVVMALSTAVSVPASGLGCELQDALSSLRDHRWFA